LDFGNSANHPGFATPRKRSGQALLEKEGNLNPKLQTSPQTPKNKKADRKLSAFLLFLNQN